MEGENYLVVVRASHKRAAAPIRTRPADVEGFSGQAQLEHATAPVREVKERIEIAVHPRVLVALEAAPVVMVYEAPRGDAGARRIRPKLGHLLFGERPVDGLEFVILVLAHCCRP